MEFFQIVQRLRSGTSCRGLEPDRKVYRKMKIFLVGVACVGSTSIGKRLAQKMNCKFFDYTEEVERFFSKPIARIKSKFLTEYSFRKEAAIVIKKIINKNKDADFVVALPPSGMHAPYHRLIRSIKSTVIAICDSPENILKRITFYDDDSNRIDKVISDREKRLYLREIKKDITYYKTLHKKADYTVDITAKGIDESAEAIQALLKEKRLI